MGAGRGWSRKLGHAHNVDLGTVANNALHQATRSCHTRKREYPTMAAAEIDMPPTQAPYKCAFGTNGHWHRVSVRRSE